MLRMSSVTLILCSLLALSLLLMPSSAKATPQSAAHLLVERGFGNVEQLNDNSPMNGASAEGDIMDKVESRLMGALELLQTYREAPIVPKFTEKRKNKFEFIRFGKRR